MPTILALPGFDPSELKERLKTVKLLDAPLAVRDAARKNVRLICDAEVLPMLESPATPAQPTTEPVCPAAVLATASKYLQRTLLQANGCYEQRWFDASSVMIRKLIENLIIDVYEKHGKDSEIKKDDNYFMLSGLITALLNQKYWQLQRETKKALPQIKSLGDRAAHNRRFEATRQDIDKIVPGLRATVDDLAHLAGHK